MNASLILVGVVNGVLMGLVLSLMASGFNLSLGVANVVNFQYGAFVLWAMYAVFFAWKYWGLSPLFSMPMIALIGFFIGYFMQRWLVSRSLATPEDSQILFAVALLIALQHLAHLAFTGDALYVRDNLLSGTWIVGVVYLQYTYVGAAVLALVFLLGLHLLLNSTSLGRNLRACAQNKLGARLSGLNVEHLYGLAMGISAVCAVVSGCALALIMSIVPERAFEFTLIAVVVSVLGGLGSMTGSIVGGLIVGILTSVFQVMGYGAIAQAVIYAFVVLIFLFRPTGLLRRQGI